MAVGAKVRKWAQYFLLFTLALLVSLSGCQKEQVIFPPEPLPAVESLPLPELPEWIEQISPTGDVASLAQIRIRFQEPLIPLESLDSPQQEDLLSKFEILPSLPGEFRFLTPRMVCFQADKAIPQATRVRVTLKAGLADLSNHTLETDLAWTFQTQGIKLTNLPGAFGGRKIEDVEPLDVRPSLKVTSNSQLDLDSLKEHIQLTSPEVEESVELEVNLEKPLSPQFDPSQRKWVYSLKPSEDLEKATIYTLEFTPGLQPQGGNLPSEVSFKSKIKTYAPLEFKELSFAGKPNSGGVSGRFSQGIAQLKFSNGLVAESALKNIKLEPEPKEETEVIRAYEGSNVISFNPWSLEPNTSYKITIGAELEDKFGQTLGETIRKTYSTTDLSADFWAATGFHVFPATKELQLNLSAVNLPKPEYKAAYRVVQPRDLVYTDSAYPSGSNSLLPPSSAWQTFAIEETQKNKTKEIAVPLREQLGGATGMLAYGAQTRTNSYLSNGQKRWREPSYYGLVQLTNLGVFAQWFPESGFIRVHHLDNGKAVANTPVEVYQSQLGARSRPQPQACATGTTDATGTLILTGEAWQGCLGQKKSSEGSGPELLVIAREGEDWAFARTFAYSGAYDYGISPGWDDGKPKSRGTIFSDRQLYQPGEKVGLTAAAYYLQNGTLEQDRNATYQVQLQDPNGKIRDLGRQTTNRFGTFSVELDLEEDEALGFYSLVAKRDGLPEIKGEFRVAQFNPPNFKVELSVDQKFAFRDQEIEAKAQGNYLFGAPLQGAEVKYYVTRSRSNFTPEGWEKFSFGRRWFWPEQSPEVPSDVLQRRQILNGEGRSSQRIRIGKDLPYPMTYRIDAEVTDVANLAVSNSRTFTALPSNRIIGLKSDFVADSNETFAVEVIVTDAEGKAIVGENINLELQQIDYSSVTQIVAGSLKPRNQVAYKTVQEVQLRSGKQAKSVELTPPDSGSYRIRANFSNAENEVTASDRQIWVTGSSPAYWGSRYRNNRLEVRLDKDSYAPGETATALIQSPYEEGELYFAVIRHGKIYSETRQVKGGAPEIKFKVTPQMLPNAAVEAVLVRQGQPLEQVEPGSLDKLVKVGFAPFKTKLEDKYLQVKVAAQNEELQPGEEQTLNLEVKDSNNQPVVGQFTVMVVNEAVLQLTGYRPPDLVQKVYAEQTISTRFADNRPDVVLATQASFLEKGWGYGGGTSAGGANTRVRTDFRPLAYYNGSVISNEEGKARVSFQLPDDLTTWRVMVVATDGDLHFGNGESTFISTKPLLSNPILPQFVRPGDSFEAGLSVTNNTKLRGKLRINGTLDGSVKFAKNRAKYNRRIDAPSGTKAYRFPMVAQEVGTGKVQFASKIGPWDDAFAVDLEVKPLEITEQVVETGTTETQVTIPLNIEKRKIANAGGLEINLASTLIPEIIAPAKQVFTEDSLPFLETTSSQLLIAANLKLLAANYGQTFNQFNPSQQANQALIQLQKLQLPDGGFAYLPGRENSNPYLSAYATNAISQAIKAGIAVDSNLTNNLKSYLRSILANPSQYRNCYKNSCKNQIRLKALIALGELGDRRSDYLVSVYEQRDNLSDYDKISLIRYLFQFPQWQKEAQEMLNQFQETIYETGRSARVNLPSSWRWLSSNTTLQAQTLRLFIDQNGNPEVINRLLQGLLDLRRQGTWQTSYDNAQALSALVDYAQLQPTPPDFTATAKLQRRELANFRFSGYQNTSQQLQIPISQLPRGKNDLVLQKSGSGTLHYLTAYRYRLQGNQPGRLNGLRITRSIRPANQQEVLRKIGLAPEEKALKLTSGQVFDIGLEIISDHSVDHVLITDNLPGGLEAVDTSFQTTANYFQPQQDSWEISYQKIHRDRIIAYGENLEAGVYTLHYLVRSVTPGTFLWPGAEVHLQYAPEEFGRSASSSLEVN